MNFQHLIGQRSAPGPEIVVDRARVKAFCRAIGVVPIVRVPLLLVVSLLPALGAGREVPLPEARATINYGLNRIDQFHEVEIGAVLQATFTIASIEEIGPALQIVRTAEISANGRLALIVETLTRLMI